MTTRIIRAAVAALALAAIAVTALTVPGCGGSSAEDSSGVHQPSVLPETYTEVRDAIEDAGYRIEGGDVLMFRLSEDRVRAEGDFAAEAGGSVEVLELERRDGTWEIAEEGR